MENLELSVSYIPAQPGEHIRAGAHGDINAITLLLGAEEAGLELLCGHIEDVLRDRQEAGRVRLALRRHGGIEANRVRRHRETAAPQQERIRDLER